MPEPVQGAAVLRKFVTIQSQKKMEEKNTNHVRMNGYSFLPFFISKSHIEMQHSGIKMWL